MGNDRRDRDPGPDDGTRHHGDPEGDQDDTGHLDLTGLRDDEADREADHEAEKAGDGQDDRGDQDDTGHLDLTGLRDDEGPAQQSEPVQRRTRRTWLIAGGVLVALVLVAGTAAAMVGMARSGGPDDAAPAPAAGSTATSRPTPSPTPGPTPGPAGGAPTATAPTSPAAAVSPAPPYALTAAGINGFLQTYAAHFGTASVNGLTLYDAYAIVDVPVPGRDEQQGWTYRDGLGWTRFGGVRAAPQGAVPIDTDQIDVGALRTNLRRARTTLAVPSPTRADVVLRGPTIPGGAPALELHVGNDFDQEGVLTTDLAGRVVAAAPFTGQ